MTADPMPGTDARAQRLLRWYPRTWRARYGAEFAELLAAEIADRPRCHRRTADVAASGLRARLADVGLTRHGVDQDQAARSGTATFVCCAAAFAMFGAAMWSQLAIGLQWQAPEDPGITQALDLESVALLTFAVVALLGLGALIRAAIVTAVRSGGRKLTWPSALMLIGLLVLAIGGRHFENAWPGTGGHLLAHQALVPAGVAAFVWATTTWITSYVVHPAALLAFPGTQLAWMAISLAAAAMVIGGAAQFARRLDRSPRAIRFETSLGYIAGAAMVLFGGGALRWLSVTAGLAQPAFHAGIIDVTGLAILTCALVVGTQAMRQAAAPPAAGR